MAVKVLSRPQLKALLQSAVKAGVPICAPTPAERVEYMFAPTLLDLARRKGFSIWLSGDRARIEFDDEIPWWFACALAQNYQDVLEYMQAGFLSDWRRPWGAE